MACRSVIDALTCCSTQLILTEHASSNKALCQQAACKRNAVNIETGELRIGTNTLFAKEGEQRWYIAWRHWCVFP